MKNRKDFIFYLVIIASFILLVFKINRLDFYDLSNEKYSGIISNILLIIVMIYVIRKTERIIN